jgi:hypothetical protein
MGNTARTLFWVSCSMIHLYVTSHTLFVFSRGLLNLASAFLTNGDAVPIFFIWAVCLSYLRLREVIKLILSAKKIKPLQFPIFPPSLRKWYSPLWG